MEAKEKNIQQQVQFWALVGPFISLLTILVSFMKYSPLQYTFASVMVLAIPVCWKWRMRGFAIAMGVIMAVVAYQFLDMTFDQRIWIGGITAAFSLSLLSTALSFEEISSLMDSMQVESKSRLDNVLRLDEKFKQVSDQYQSEERLLKSKIQENETELSQYKNRVASSEKLAQVVREELAATHKRNEELLQELYDARSKSQQLDRKMVQLEAQLAETVQKDFSVEMEELKGEVALLQQRLAKKEEEAGLLELQVEFHQEEMAAKEKQLVEQSQEIKTLKDAAAEQQQAVSQFKEIQDEMSHAFEAERKKLIDDFHQSHERVLELETRLKDNEAQLQSLKLTVKEREQEFVIECRKLEEEKQRSAEQELVLHKLLEEAKSESERLLIQHQQVSEELAAVQVHYTALQDEMKAQQEAKVTEASATKKTSKKETSALRQAEGRYKQLKEQFDEKSEVLDETRRALFHMQEDLLNLQRETEERKVTEKSEFEALLEQHLKKMEEERKQLEADHQQEIDDLHEIIASLSKKK